MNINHHSILTKGCAMLISIIIIIATSFSFEKESIVISHWDKVSHEGNSAGKVIINTIIMLTGNSTNH